MTLRRSFRPLRPDLDKFLFAAVGEEIDGIPLSTISTLTRLGLDPWQETGRLSSLPRREAVEQVARLIAEIPGILRPLVLRISQMFQLGSARYRRLGDSQADELNQLTEI
jgi:hypothetical protein